ncbi:hypothetical protein LY76DRAFT_52844 [Colletotrichum caudatum]|nr:hypothetical protein LY76DRAFT_52844 [Colletotrichum caudatum]
MHLSSHSSLPRKGPLSQSFILHLGTSAANTTNLVPSETAGDRQKPFNYELHRQPPLPPTLSHLPRTPRARVPPPATTHPNYIVSRPTRRRSRHTE